MPIDLSKVDFDAMVSEMKAVDRSSNFLKAVLGLGFLDIESTPRINEIYTLIREDGSYRLESLGIHLTKDEQKSKSLEDMAYYRWMDISQKSIDEADTYEKAIKAWDEAPPNTYVKENGMMKMLELAPGKKQIMVIFYSAPYGSLSKRKALEKLTTFFPKEKSEEEQKSE